MTASHPSTKELTPNVLRVWWIPQVLMQPFYVPVSSVAEGVKIMDVLAEYDLFQHRHHVKPDYCNVGGLQMLEDGEWVDWCTEDGEDDPRAWLEERAA